MDEKNSGLCFSCNCLFYRRQKVARWKDGRARILTSNFTRQNIDVKRNKDIPYVIVTRQFDFQNLKALEKGFQSM